MPDVLCPAATPTALVRNVAARGRLRTFTLRVGQPVGGIVTVRSGALPFFLGARRSVLPLQDGVTARRGFFDASFEIVVTAGADVLVRLE